MQRLLCPDCLHPRSVCWCAVVRPVACRTEVLILQHPQELGHAKNTALLLQRCLGTAARTIVGESWDTPSLTQWLHGDGKHSLLLYPPSVPDAQLPLLAPPPLPPQWLRPPVAPAQLRLVVLDGTWRKSRKMLYANAPLQQLPRLALDTEHLPPGRYHIRKAQAPGQRSTFEASTLALAQLGGITPAQLQQLDAVFDAWVEQVCCFATKTRTPPPTRYT